MITIKSTTEQSHYGWSHSIILRFICSSKLWALWERWLLVGRVFILLPTWSLKGLMNHHNSICLGLCLFMNTSVGLEKGLCFYLRFLCTSLLVSLFNLVSESDQTTAHQTWKLRNTYGYKEKQAKYQTKQSKERCYHSSPFHWWWDTV